LLLASSMSCDIMIAMLQTSTALQPFRSIPIYLHDISEYDFWNKIIQWRHRDLAHPLDVLTCQYKWLYEQLSRFVIAKSKHFMLLPCMFS
jgi:hypothetical protein